jgi:hypothetical protein
MPEQYNTFDWDAVGELLANNPYQYDDFIPADATSTKQGFEISENIDKGMLLSKGRYIFTIGKPAGTITDLKELLKDSIVVDGELKDFEIYDLKYNFQNDKLQLFVNIIDNPIPILVIWGAVAIAVMITGAITTSSILEDITPIVDVVTSPIGYGILLIFLIPIIIPLLKQLKKGKK